MISTMYQVKRFRGMFDGESDTDPDVNFDSSAGYYVGFRLLVTSGLSFVCTDDTVGAAVWDADTEYDSRILSQLQAVSEIVVRFCNSYFEGAQPDYHECKNGVFVGNKLTDTQADFDDLFFPGDSIIISGSRRNDGVYALEAVGTTELTINTQFSTDMTDQSGFAIVSIIWPYGLKEIGARMAEYDVYRRNESPGLAQESSGTYNASKEVTDVMGHGYPASVVAGIAGYKKPKIAGYPLLDFRTYR